MLEGAPHPPYSRGGKLATKLLGLLTFLMAAGLSGTSRGDATTPAGSGELAAHATDLAKRCVEESRGSYRSVWGSPLRFDRAIVRRDSAAGFVFVYIPEQAPKGKPQGLDLRINLSSGACTKLRME